MKKPMPAMFERSKKDAETSKYGREGSAKEEARDKAQQRTPAMPQSKRAKVI